MAETLTIRTASSTEVVKIAVPGPQGATGQGVPVGGSTGQVLRKKTGTDYDTEWAAAGSGSGSVTSVALASTDLTISGSPITDSGTITANIAANAVTLEKLQTISSEHLLGRHGNGSGGVQQIGLSTGLAMSGSNVRVATTGITAGTYTKLTIDETGRATAGATATPSDIGAQSIFSVESLVITTTSQVTLTAARAKIYEIVQYAGAAVDVKLPSTNAMQGDIVVFRWGTGSDSINVVNSDSPSVVATVSAGEQKRFIRGATNTWTLVPVDTHTHAASAITSGSFGNISHDGKIGSTAGLPVVTTTAGAVTTLALGTANQVLRVNSGATGVEFADPAASGVTGAAASASDVLGVSGANITGVDAGAADRLVFWDDSASKLTYLEAGSGLSISGTTLTATASGGTKTYAVFTAEHNQPPSTAFATLDTRNSIAVLDFDAATDENAVFVGIMPEAASLGSGLIVRLHWMATSATSGNVRWGVQFERSNTDLDADSFDTAVEATAATNGTSGIITTTAITVTTIDGITAGDVFRLKVFRNADDATNDTMTGDAELVAVEVRSAA